MFFLLVSHEAISTGNPEILSLVLQHRDFQRGSQRLAGIPELLDELNAVSLSHGWFWFNFLLDNKVAQIPYEANCN